MPYIGALSEDEYRAMPQDARIRLAAADLIGWRYVTGSGVHYPYYRPHLPATLVDFEGRGIDCSSFTSYILFTAYPDGAWTDQSYQDLQIMDPNRPWSPIEAVENAGVGSRVDAPTGGLWHLTQAWKSVSPLTSGHARMIYADPDDPDSLLVLESSNRFNLVGAVWTKSTWTDLCAMYPAGIRAAALGPG